MQERMAALGYPLNEDELDRCLSVKEIADRRKK
jgi:hypothetical protein